jgi:hypothetical protein
VSDLTLSNALQSTKLSRPMRLKRWACKPELGPQQRPLLGAMVGVKKSDGTISQPGSAQSDTKANDPNNSAASGNASGSNGQLSEADSELTVLVQNQLREALEHFHLHQCIDIYPAAPLGYFMEVPDGGIPIKSGDAGSDGVFRALQIGMWTMLPRSAANLT